MNDVKRIPAAEELAWAAGLFDGEGTVSISRQDQIFPQGHPGQGRHTYYTLNATMWNTHRLALLRFQSWFGGDLYGGERGRLRADYKPIWRWRTSARTAAGFLRAVRPYLVIKAREADVGLRFQALIRVHKWPRLSIDELAEREGLRRALITHRKGKVA